MDYLSSLTNEQSMLICRGGQQILTASLLEHLKFSAVVRVVVAIKKPKHSASSSVFGKNLAKFCKNIHRQLEFIFNEFAGLT